MKKSRFFKTVVFALILSLTLALPALAFEDADPPIWQQWGYDSMQDFMDSNGLTAEEEYYDYIADYVQDWKEDQKEQRRWEQWRDEYLAAHPDYKQSLLDQSPALWEQMYYDSKEEFVDWNGLTTEEDYENYLVEWYLYPEFEKTLEAERIARERWKWAGRPRASVSCGTAPMSPSRTLCRKSETGVRWCLSALSWNSVAPRWAITGMPKAYPLSLRTAGSFRLRSAGRR